MYHYFGAFKCVMINKLTLNKCVVKIVKL